MAELNRDFGDNFNNSFLNVLILASQLRNENGELGTQKKEGAYMLNGDIMYFYRPIRYV